MSRREPDELIYRPIGTIRSPYREPGDMPIQPVGARGVAGSVEVLPEYRRGLADLEGFSHLYLLYHFHRSQPFTSAALAVRPFLDDQDRGVFATRAPRRPNPIGLSVVRLISVREAVLTICDVDVVDGTPLLDVKPYVPAWDAVPEARAGWLEARAGRAADLRADGRFSRSGEDG